MFVFLGIKEVIYGCYNDRFGGNGSVLKLQDHIPNKYKSIGFPYAIYYKLVNNFFTKEDCLKMKLKLYSNNFIKEEMKNYLLN